jgi:hypothetical protein
MLRILAVAIAGVLVLASGPAEAGRSDKEKYVAGVKGSVDADRVDRLFDEVVNSQYLCALQEREPRSSGPICGTDTRTAVGLDWLRSERRLYSDMQGFLDVLGGMDPPDEVARLHVQWLTAIRRCASRLKRLESAFDPVDNLDVIDAFEKEVAREMDWCFDRFAEIIPAFEEKGYVFTRGSGAETG